MPESSLAANPFMLMMNPQVIFDSIEHSERLERLQRRVCHPLDKPVAATALAQSLASHDRAIDAQYERDMNA